MSPRRKRETFACANCGIRSPDADGWSRGPEGWLCRHCTPDRADPLDVELDLDVGEDIFGSSWCAIERAVHAHRQWFEPVPDGGPNSIGLMWSGRINRADVEGPPGEMLRLADAILERGTFDARRCAMRWRPGWVELWSPRNSRNVTRVTHGRALELAAKIKAKLGTPATTEGGADAEGQ